MKQPTNEQCIELQKWLASLEPKKFTVALYMIRNLSMLSGKHMVIAGLQIKSILHKD